MKVVSLVPSWTEMLLHCGINVVGRTRFCVHPQSQITSIPAVGGTKDLDFDKLQGLGADLLILDQEENLEWMKEKTPIPVLVTHVTSVSNVANEISKLEQALHNPKLSEIAERWKEISQKQLNWNWQKIPGEIHKIRQDHSSYQNLVYVIWKNPWMRVSQETFIGSVLTQLGAGKILFPSEKKYPEFQLSDFDLEKTYFLFSSEPFPFHKKLKDLEQLGVQGSVVDGESFSWFGLRSLQFLEKTYSSAAY